MHTAIQSTSLEQIRDRVQSVGALNSPTDSPQVSASPDLVDSAIDDLLRSESFVEQMAFLYALTEEYELVDREVTETGQIEYLSADWRENAVGIFSWHLLAGAIEAELSRDEPPSLTQTLHVIEEDPMKTVETAVETALSNVENWGVAADDWDGWFDAISEAIMESRLYSMGFIEQMYFLSTITDEYGLVGEFDTHVKDSLHETDWRNGVSLAFSTDLMRGAITAEIDRRNITTPF